MTGNEIDRYIEAAPKRAQAKLVELRRIIRAAAPDATETMSYRMPAYKLGRILVYFAAFEDHVSLFPTPSGVAAFEERLGRYEHSKGTIQFPLDQPLPAALVRRIVRFRVAENTRKDGAGRARRK